MRAKSLWAIVLVVGLWYVVSSPADGACGLPAGDRVELTVDHPGGHPTLWAGMRGTVICSCEGCGLPVLVSWDNWTDGHENTWPCTTLVLPHVSSSCWWMSCDQLAPVPAGVPDILDGGEQDRYFRPQTFVAGRDSQALEVGFTVVNGGKGDPQNTIYVDVYASRDTSITPSDYLLGTVDCFVSGGGSLTKTLRTVLPTRLPPGLYYIAWILDPQDLIPDELDETNNTAYVSSYRLLVFCPPDIFSLESSAALGGWVTTPGEGIFAYPDPRQVEVSASADAGCVFAGWVGTAVDAGKVADPKAATTQVLVDAQYDLTAVFGGPHLIVEDFEGYNAASPVNAVWVDGPGWQAGDPQGRRGNGTGATLGNAESPAPGNPTMHGGTQAMVFDYDNGKPPYYSEASRRWGALQNWAATGADMLSIWYRGAVNNAGQPLYVVVEDYHGGVAVVTHPDPLAVQSSDWSQWLISLREIQAAGVMLSRVVRLCIGVGDRTNPFMGGAGTLYFDDITFAHTWSGGSPPDGRPPKPKAVDSPAAYWKLDEASGDIARQCRHVRRPIVWRPDLAALWRRAGGGASL